MTNKRGRQIGSHRLGRKLPARIPRALPPAQCGTHNAEDPLCNVAALFVTGEPCEQLRQGDAGSGKSLGNMLLYKQKKKLF